MPEEFTLRIGRNPAKTNLTAGEKQQLYKLQALLKCSSEADVIRQVLRDRMKAEGLLP